MPTKVGRTFENFLISDDAKAIWLLPSLALIFGLAALWGSGLFGKPDVATAEIRESYVETIPGALKAADGNTYAQWTGPPQAMSDFIRDQITRDLRQATDEVDFQGKAFSAALEFTDMAIEDASAGTVQAGANNGATSSADAAEEPATAPVSPLENSKLALDRWTKDYWCSRRSWGPAWSRDIVLPLVSRGVGGCTSLEQFYARSPLISGLGVGLGVFLFALFCLFAIASLFGFGAQLLLREAYRMSYRSAVIRE